MTKNIATVNLGKYFVMTPEELQKRLKEFAYKVVRICGQLTNRKECKIIEDQLMRSAFSAAANYRAACKAQSGRSFTARLSISYEEMDESLLVGRHRRPGSFTNRNIIRVTKRSR